MDIKLHANIEKGYINIRKQFLSFRFARSLSGPVLYILHTHITMYLNIYKVHEYMKTMRIAG